MEPGERGPDDDRAIMEAVRASLPEKYQTLGQLGVEDIWLAMSEHVGQVFYVHGVRIFDTENYGEGTELACTAGEGTPPDVIGRHVRLHTWSENVRSLMVRLVGDQASLGTIIEPPLRVEVATHGRVLTLK